MPEPPIARRADIPAVSRPLLGLFRAIVRRYFRRHFHAVRLSGTHHLASVQGPLIVYANHGSWWDPMVSYLLAARLLGDRPSYAPMDAAALVHYPVLRKLGIFPVEMSTLRGAARFLRTGRAVLGSGGALWITPQGQFTDARQRPLVFKPGMAALAARMGQCTLVPLAIEYTFWDERLPEALLLVGAPVEVAGDSAESLNLRLVSALETCMDDLRERALTRSPDAFEQILSFRAPGAGGMYALAQRVRAFVSRKPYRAEHTPSRPRHGAVPQ